MYRYPLIFGIIVIALIIGIFSLFGHKTTKQPTTTVPTAQVLTLPDYAKTSAKVSFTFDGPINGDDAHRAIRITVSKNERDIDIVQGYSGYVITHKQFYNSEAAYNSFLRAINTGGFLLPLKNSKAGDSELGQCPMGYRYILDLNQDGKQISRLWTTSCGSATGTFGGDTRGIQALFDEQITDYQDFVGNVVL